jgi:hypothetical protein
MKATPDMALNSAPGHWTLRDKAAQANEFKR